MSRKTGRNDPCPCGSGSKYKRCCLPREEAARLDAVRQQEFRESDEELEDDDELIAADSPPFDFDAVERIRYDRGVVQTIDRVGTGEGLRATVWAAPAIPQQLLDTLSLEALDELDGPWGDETAGDPIQVDLIEIETGDDIVVIEILNRAAMLLRGSQDMVRLHRACVALETAADRGVDVPAGIGAETQDGDEPEEPRFTLDDALETHRQQRGRCSLCGAELTKAGARRHVERCAPEHDAGTGAQQDLLHLRVTAPGAPGYWLDLEIRADAKLAALDDVLRGIWLECCGHLSRFDIAGVEYASRPADDAFPMFGARRQRSMGATVEKALAAAGDRFTYEYDFGSTSRLQLDVRGARGGRIGRQTVRLVARNNPLVWPCALCGEPAESVCTQCIGESANPFVCAAHAPQHPCGDEALLPVVNSPRMGVCGYSTAT
jgi:hypothetical protein